MVGRGVAGRGIWRRLCGRVFGYQLAVRINKNCLLCRVYRVALVKDFLFYPLPFAIEEILRDLVAVVSDLGLFVIAVECKASALRVVDQVSIVVKMITVRSFDKSVSCRINCRVGNVRLCELSRSVEV